MYTMIQQQCAVILILLFTVIAVWAPSIVNAQQTSSESEGVIVNNIEDLIGIWESQHGASGAKAYRQYETDGTIREAYSRDNLQTSPLHTGHVWFEDNIYHQKNDHPLAPDSPGRYEVRIHKAKNMPDRLSFRVLDDKDKYRIKDLAQGMIRVETSPQASAQVVKNVEELVGTWEALLGGAKASMEFKEDGTYTISSPSNSVPGKFWFEGEEFHIRCPYGHGVYSVQIQKAHDNTTKLSFTLIEDEVDGRITDLAEGMSREP